MAVAQGDGSIILSTKIDDSGARAGIKQLKQDTAGLGDEAKKTGSKQTDAMKKTSSEIDKASKKTEKFGDEAQKSGKKASSAFNGISGTLKTIAVSMASAFSVSVLVNFGKEAINLASDLQEVQNVVDTAFGEMAYKIENFSKSAIENFGISELTAKRTASTYMAMAKGMGLAEDVGSDMALTLTGLTADMSSFYNVSQEVADTALKSVFTGETESLKQYGIVMTEVNLQEFARTQGINKSISAMNQQEKTVLRYQYILQQTALAQGDFAKTSDSWANQTRILSEKFKEMQAVFGETFMTIGMAVLPLLNDLISGLTLVAQYASIATQRLFQMFTGKELKVSDTSSPLRSIKKQADETAESVSAIGDSIKAVKKSLAGFDTAQILGSSAGGGASAGGVTTGGSSVSTADLPSIYDFGEGEDGDETASKETETMLFTILGVARIALLAIGCILIATGHLAWGIGFILASAAVEEITEAAIESGSVSEEAEKAMGKGIVVAGIVALVLGILLCVAKMYTKGIPLIAVGVIGIVQAIAVNWDTISNQLQGVLGVAVAVVGIIAVVLGVLLCIAQVWGLGLGLIALGVVGIVLPIVANWDSIEEALQGPLGAVALLVGTALLVLGVILLFTGAGVALGLGLIVAGGLSLAAAIVPNWDFITEKISDIWDKVKEFWNEYIAPIFTAEWWLNLGKDCINGLIEGFESGINGIITMFENMVNFVIRGLNKISISLPDWAILGDLAGATFGIDIDEVSLDRVSIPRLAKGAVIPGNREFLAVLGDQPAGQTNIEAPASLIKQMAKEAIAEMGFGQTVKEEHFYLDEVQLMSVLYRLTKGGERMQGESLVTGGAF